MSVDEKNLNPGDKKKTVAKSTSHNLFENVRDIDADAMGKKKDGELNFLKRIKSGGRLNIMLRCFLL